MGNAWATPGWVFDNVLEDIARHVGPRDPELSHAIQEAIEGVQYLDASQWSSGRLLLLLEGARISRQQRLRAGPSAFQKPEFFPGFMTQVEQLIAQVELDPRLHGHGQT
ncbi:MAG: hypothetical protein U1E39_03490 [Planctomycetota bacterium]